MSMKPPVSIAYPPAGESFPPKVVIDPALIPDELKALKSWMLWHYAWKDGVKWGKPPVYKNAEDGLYYPASKGAKGQPSPNFMSFDQAWAAYESDPDLSGIGIAIEAGTGIFAYDADGCVDPDWDGDLVPLRFDSDVHEFLEATGVWATVSPSGKGVRGFGRVPELGPNVSGFWRTVKKDGRELYFPTGGANYFVTVTTDLVSGVSELPVCSQEILAEWTLRLGGGSGTHGSAGPMPVLGVGLSDDEMLALGMTAEDIAVLDDVGMVKGGRHRLVAGIAGTMYRLGAEPGDILATMAERVMPMSVALDRRGSAEDALDWLWTYPVGNGILQGEARKASVEFDSEGDGTYLDRFGGVAGVGASGSGPKVVSWLDSAVDIGAGLGSGGIVLPGPRPVLFRDAYSRGEASLTFGYGGGGKSILAMVEAVAMCLDASWFGVGPMEPDLRVLYVNLDDKVSELVRRTWAICAAYGVGYGALAGRFMVIGSDSIGIDTRFLLVEGTRTVVNRAAWLGLEAAVGGMGADVVVLDPLANFTEANESNSDMIRVAEAAAHLAIRTNSSVHFVHHTRKASSGEQGGVTRSISTDDARGGGALTGRVRHARSVRKLTPEEAAKIGVEPDRAGYFIRVDSGLKPNYTPVQYADIYELKSVDLHNGQGRRPSDKVGVPTLFSVAVSATQVSELWAAIKSRPADQLLPPSRHGQGAVPWKEVSAELNMPYVSVCEAVDRWISEGYLVETEYKTPQRKTKKGLVCGEEPPEVFDTTVDF